MCAIQSGPTKELTEYIQATRTSLQAINSKYPSICKENSTDSASFNKVLAVIDKAQNQVPVMNNLIADFSYNVLTVAKLESSPIVIRHGNLLYNLEKTSILPTIESLASKCQLDGPAAAEVIAILEKNNQVQDFFKNTVIWNTASANTPLEQSILSNYSEEATISCKDELDISVWIESITKKSEWFGSDISAAKKRWEDALKLIQWWSSKWKEDYNKLQTRLLRQELARQWVGKNAMEQMLGNLECAQADSDEKNNIEKQSLSQEKCKRKYVLWLENLEKILTFKIKEAKTSDEYIKIVEKWTKRLTEEVDILDLYSKLQSSIKSENNTDATTTSIITNLINIHTNLVWINTSIEKRIPKMTENCMKWSPDIIGWC